MKDKKDELFDKPITVLRFYRDKQEEADEYYRENKFEIDKLISVEESERILLKLPTLLSEDCMVWCREGDVVSDATPCANLNCKHKKNKADIVNGCASCKRFQITSISNKWDTAVHLCDSCSVEEY